MKISKNNSTFAERNRQIALNFTGAIAETADSIAGPGIFIVLFYFAARYSLLGPVLRVGAAGVSVAGFVSIFDYFFSSRDTRGSLTMGTLFGAAVISAFVLTWNALKGFWYLLKETVVFIQNYDVIRDAVRIRKTV